MKLLQDLRSRKLISPPQWLPENAHYVTEMGSVAYGVSGGSSDRDIYGFVIPPKDDIFPHLRGEIPGFGRQKKRFAQWQEHHVQDKDRDTEWDFQLFSIVKFFQLCMENNPNMVDALFTPTRCILHCTHIGNMVRDSRKMFLHKGSYHKFRGYAHSQLHKMTIKNPEGKRRLLLEQYGYDTKYAYHLVRLVLECEQILVHQDIDLECNSEILKSIRRGEWSEQRIREWYATKERGLEELYNSSTLRYKPDEKGIKDLLMNCLEHHYGDLSAAVVREDEALRALRQIHEISNGYFLTN